jgi:four helix bundle protein
MSSQAEALRRRVREFAVRVLKFVRTLPRDPAGDTAARQLARSGTAVSANYHATGRARSRAEFIAKLGVVVEEADEAEHWLFIIQHSGLAGGEALGWLVRESAELRAIFSAALRTARLNRRGQGQRCSRRRSTTPLDPYILRFLHPYIPTSLHPYIAGCPTHTSPASASPSRRG